MPVTHEDAAKVNEVIPLYFTWLDNLAREVRSDHHGLVWDGVIADDAAEMIRQLVMIAVVPRSQISSKRWADVREYTMKRLATLYGPFAGSPKP